MFTAVLVLLSAFPFIIAIIVWYYVAVIKQYKLISHFPGPKPNPITGNAAEFWNSLAFLPQMMKYRDEFGGIYKVSMGPTRTILVVSDTKFLEVILTSMKFLDKSPDYRSLHDWLGMGLLTSTGKQWHKHRKIITPAFHFQILEQFVESFNSNSSILIKKLEKEIGNKSFDIYPYITLCALDVICETAMGTSVNAQDDPGSEYVRSVKEMSRIAVDRAFSLIKQFDILYPLSKDYYKQRRYIKVLHGFSNNVIKRRREALINSKDNDVTAKDDFGKKRKMAFLDLLLHATVNDRSLSDSDIREEVDTFMFEGHDTTASAITFAIHHLANDKRVQDKAFEEIFSIFGNDTNRPASYRDLQDMQYMDLIIKETLRMYPSVPFYARELTEDIEFNGKLVPKGLTVNIFAFGIQRDPKMFPNPDLFNPERFSIENQKERPFYSYIPFSAGPRNCIGQKFATLELKSTISKILRHYELRPSNPKHEIVLNAETILKSANGVRLQILKRKYPGS